MAYKSPLQEIPSNLARTVLGTLKFGGRSTRTEVWTYSLIGNFVAALLGGVLALLTGESVDFGPSVSESVATIAYFLPVPALFARRFHDMGWSGWFAFVLPVILVFAVFSENMGPAMTGVQKLDFGWPGVAIGLCFVVFLFTISLAPPTIGPNRYGRDPRNDEPQSEPSTEVP